MVDVAKYDSDEFIRRQVGMVTEVLTDYGPVNRFWCVRFWGGPPPTTPTRLRPPAHASTSACISCGAVQVRPMLVLRRYATP